MNCYHIFFRTVSNRIRVNVILSLAKSKKSVTELCKELNVEQSKLSHALRALRTCNIVKVKTAGKKRI